MDERYRKAEQWGMEPLVYWRGPIVDEYVLSFILALGRAHLFRWQRSSVDIGVDRITNPFKPVA